MTHEQSEEFSKFYAEMMLLQDQMLRPCDGKSAQLVTSAAVNIVGDLVAYVGDKDFTKAVSTMLEGLLMSLKVDPFLEVPETTQ